MAVGLLGRPHGIKGELRLDPKGTMPRGLKGYSRFYAAVGKGEPEPLAIAGWRSAGDVILIKVAGIEDRDKAGLLTGRTVLVPREDLPRLAVDEYYHDDLIGAPVVDEAETGVGVITDVKPWGDYDMLVIKTGSKSWMLPVVGDYVLEIRNDPPCLVVRVPEGLGP